MSSVSSPPESGKSDQPRVIQVPDHKYRGITFLLNGQRCDTWLPAGEHTVGRTTSLSVGRGSSQMATARELCRENCQGIAETWYIDETVYQRQIGGAS